jgi:orotidine-5'-phosphate decarboxylase
VIFLQKAEIYLKVPKEEYEIVCLDDYEGWWQKNRDAKIIFASQIENDLHVCVGIDPVWEKIPAHLKEGRSKLAALVDFCISIVDATHEYAHTYKLNAGFFEAYYGIGQQAARYVIAYIHIYYPEIMVIFDGKRGDIGPSNEMYKVFPFATASADALTVSGYLGRSEEFLRMINKLFFYLVYTSNPEAQEIQELPVSIPEKGTIPLFLVMAEKVAGPWNNYRNTGVVATATKPEKIKETRAVIGEEEPMLVPAVGRQKGKLEESVKAGGRNTIVNASTTIAHASSGLDFMEKAKAEAKRMHEVINQNLAMA